MEKIIVRKVENIETTQLTNLWIILLLIGIVSGGIIGLLMLIGGIFRPSTPA